MITAAAADRPLAAGDEVVLTTAGDTLGDTYVPADRGNGNHDNGDDDDDGWCISEDGSVVGPVCVDIDEIDVLSDILST